MEKVDNFDLAELLAAKEKRRHELAALPFPQKVAVVVKLQEMAAPILRARGKLVQPWRLDWRSALSNTTRSAAAGWTVEWDAALEQFATIADDLKMK